MKKKLASLLATSLIVMALGGCGTAKTTEATTEPEKTTEVTTEAESTTEAATESGKTGDAVTVTVFAAASMTETLDEIAENYKSVAPDVTLVFNYDSSGTLKTQIEEGATCDLFISAAQKQMDQLDITADEEKNPDKLDFIDSATRINLLENQVVLAVPADNKAGINSYDDMVAGLKDKKIMLAMGNEDVPVGQYTKKIFDFYGLKEDELVKDGLITYGSNVKEVTTQVSEGTVDCGIIYSTDAYSAGLQTVDTATKEMCGQVIYPAAVLKNSSCAKEAQAFLDYLKTDESKAVFEKVGFTPLN